MSSDEKEKTLMSFVLENSGDLLSDLSFIKFACKRDQNMIKLASPSILYNTDSIYEILGSLKCGYRKFGELIPEEIYNNPKIIIKLCKDDEKALEKANYDTRNNFNIVKEIVSTVDSYAYRNFKYATPTLQTNIDLLKMFALTECHDDNIYNIFEKNIEKIDRDLFDKEFALEMCSNFGWFTKYLNESLQNDHDVLRTCLASIEFSYSVKDDDNPYNDYDISCMTYCSADNTLIRDKNFAKKCLERYFEQIVYFEGIEFIDYSFTFSALFKNTGFCNSSIRNFYDGDPFESYLSYCNLPEELKEEENFLILDLCVQALSQNDIIEDSVSKCYPKLKNVGLIGYIKEMNQIYKNFKIILMAINRDFVKSTRKQLESFSGSKFIKTCDNSCYLPKLDGFTEIKYLVADYLGINLQDEIRLIDHIKLVKYFYEKFQNLSDEDYQYIQRKTKKN
jgi:hypothetical protein